MRRRCCCTSTPTTCPVNVLVNGCGVPVPGATVSVWNNSGKTVLIGTATAGTVAPNVGRATVDVGAVGTYWVEIAHPRFATTGSSRTFSACGSSGSTTLAFSGTAAGYHCGWDNLPWADTLYWTDNVTGASAVLTYSGGSWSGTGSGTTKAVDPYSCAPVTTTFRFGWWDFQPLISSASLIWSMSWPRGPGSLFCPAVGSPPSTAVAYMTQFGATGSSQPPLSGGGVSVSGTINTMLTWNLAASYTMTGVSSGRLFVFGECFSPCALNITVSE